MGKIALPTKATVTKPKRTGIKMVAPRLGSRGGLGKSSISRGEFGKIRKTF